MIVLVCCSLAVALFSGLDSVTDGEEIREQQQIALALVPITDLHAFDDISLDSPCSATSQSDLRHGGLQAYPHQQANPAGLAPIMELPEDEDGLTVKEGHADMTSEGPAPVLEGDEAKLKALELVQSYISESNPSEEMATKVISCCYCHFEFQKASKIISFQTCDHAFHQNICYRHACHKAGRQVPSWSQLYDHPETLRCPLCEERPEDLPATSSEPMNPLLLDWTQPWNPLNQQKVLTPPFKMMTPPTDPFKEHLKSKGLEQYPIRADGNCLFASIADQLEHCRPGTTFDKHEVRVLISDYIRENREDFQHVTMQDDGSERETFDQYCDRMRQPGTTVDRHTWGGAFEIAAATKVFECNIITHIPPNQKIEFEYSCEDDTLTLHLAHVNNNHYNSCRRISDSESATNSSHEAAFGAELPSATGQAAAKEETVVEIGDCDTEIWQDSADDRFVIASECETTEEFDDVLFMNASSVQDWKHTGADELFDILFTNIDTGEERWLDADSQGTEIKTATESSCDTLTLEEYSTPPTLYRVRSWPESSNGEDAQIQLISSSTPDLTANLPNNFALAL